MSLTISHFEKADIHMVGLKLFNQIGQNHVLNPINEARGLLYHMQEQVEFIKRREK